MQMGHDRDLDRRTATAAEKPLGNPGAIAHVELFIGDDLDALALEPGERPLLGGLAMIVGADRHQDVLDLRFDWSIHMAPHLVGPEDRFPRSCRKARRAQGHVGYGLNVELGP